MWGATYFGMSAGSGVIISIRAPLCGVRLPHLQYVFIAFSFQSAHPYVGCDYLTMTELLSMVEFQSAHPYVGCDPKIPAWYSRVTNFNPRTPMWGATTRMRVAADEMQISIRAPLCGVRHVFTLVRVVPTHDFNPRTPMWGATTPMYSYVYSRLFQSAHPYVGCDNVGRG